MLENSSVWNLNFGRSFRRAVGLPCDASAVSTPFDVGSRAARAVSRRGQSAAAFAAGCFAFRRMEHRKGSGFIPSIDGGSCRLKPARRFSARTRGAARGWRSGRRTDKKGTHEHPSAASSVPGSFPLWTGRFAHHRATLPSSNEPGRFRVPAPPRGGLALFGDPHFTGPANFRTDCRNDVQFIKGQGKWEKCGVGGGRGWPG
ncbi:MAG: hypothetical protein JWL69_3906 [Phycisphaerales bacterium]|nr:hypothetical protein [Phycisphaerales bacterium]